jgi:hypothetical protein
LSAANAEDLQRKAAIAKSILDDVVASSNHEDDKLSRLLYSMSFLTVAAAVTFSSFVTNSIGIPSTGIDLVSALFVVYLVFLVAGSIMTLEAMSPRLYKLRGEQGSRISSDKLESMHFYRSIARKDVTSWLASFGSTGAELLARESDDALRQAHFLSARIEEKTGYIRKAKWMMLFAAITLMVMVAMGAFYIFLGSP